MNSAADERPTWLQRYVTEYLTLDEVGELEGITREGVRQRLLGFGIKPRSASETADLRARRETELKGEIIQRTFLQTRSIDETAAQAGLPASWIKGYIELHITDYQVLARAPRNMAKRYSAEDLSASLREAASRSVGNLTAAAYDDFVRTHGTLADGRSRPGTQTMLLRYGSWRLALQASGLPSNPHSGPQKEFDESQAVAAIVECWRSQGRPPTAETYERWQRRVGGYPSGATVRKLAGPWNSLLVRAWQIVHGVTIDQDDEEAAVPAPLLEDNENPPVSGPFVTYHNADEGTEISLPSSLVAVGYAALERAVRSHALLQNAVAQAAKTVGLTALSPSLGGPAFDVVLAHEDGRLFLVEVKSATTENLELQLRLGLGQCLRYAHQLKSAGRAVTPVIAVELQPEDSWADLLRELGVGLIVSESVSHDLEKLLQEVVGAGPT